MKECIVILGMHRSGTSVLSGLVSIQGFYLGADEMPIRDDNPKGFFENMKVYHLNQSILEKYDTSWDDYSFTLNQIKPDDFHTYLEEAKKIIREEFGPTQRIFIKDPRICLLFPLWEKALLDNNYAIKVILAYRSPMEVAHSLKVRNQFALEKSFLMWSHYFFQAERDSRAYERLLVHYSSDFKDFAGFIRKLGKFLNVEITDEILEDSIQLYTPKLTHHKQLQNNLVEDVPVYLTQLVKVLLERKISDFNKFDEIASEFYFSRSLFLYDKENIKKRIKNQESEISNISSELKANKDELNFKTKQLMKEIELIEQNYDYLEAEKNLEIKNQNQEIEKIKNQCDKLQGLIQEKKEALAKENKLKAQLEKDRISQLTIGNELFTTTLQNKAWKKKFSRILRDSSYFKNKRKFFFLAKKKNKTFLDEKIEIIESGLFSPFYYLTNHPQAWKRNVDPLNFYNKHGWKAGHNPGPHFNTRDYLSMYEDVAQMGVNPLLHYIRFGKKEGRFPMRPKGKSQVNDSFSKGSDFDFKKPRFSGPTKGKIESFIDGRISGWLLTEKQNSVPIIKINAQPTITEYINRNGINEEGINHHAGGFRFKVLSSIEKKAEIELSLLNEDGISTIDKKTIKVNFLKSSIYPDLDKAKFISGQKKAVAITVWEGAHNPIGRAKVLYDILASYRPVIIFAYVFGDFGRKLWSPLKNLGMNIVLIPYNQRQEYKNYIECNQIDFDTVWICKHRLHSFELASMITNKNSACILDMDDNEDIFVASRGSEQKPYGVYSQNKSNYYLDKIKARSVASISLQKAYGGEIVRHARKSYTKPLTIRKNNQNITAVFIGTIRPHKNINLLVEAIQRFNKSNAKKVKLAIGGDFNPLTLRDTLKTKDTIILDAISSEDLYDTLASYDVVITGFPDKKSENEEINKFQITSKIGDGLAVGKPVLTPNSPSVSDLNNVPGLYLFDHNTFADQLQAAIKYEKPVELPKEFSIEKSYSAFLALEKMAKANSKAGNVFEMEPLYLNTVKKITNKNLVLVWKQHDSGVYGRRIDHLARYYKQKTPDANVTVIEVIREDNLRSMEEDPALFDNSSVIHNDILSKKIHRYDLDGINYHLLTYKDHFDAQNSLGKKFDTFLSNSQIYPNNSVVILYPLIEEPNVLMESLVGYKVIVDIVDNQVQWMNKPEVRLKALKQYLDLISFSHEIVANSPTNLKYFENLNFFENKKPHFIPNWYSIPSSFGFQREVKRNEINLIYSGNLNDRIDWSLMNKICKSLLDMNGYLHIAGSAKRRPEQLKMLLENKNCIYHGVIGEKNLLRLLQHVNFAVVPHKEDRISKFMDPIKLKMYKKLGITSLTTKLPSLPEDDPMIIVADSSKDFINKLCLMLERHDYTKDFHDEDLSDDVGDNYIQLINQLISE